MGDLGNVIADEKGRAEFQFDDNLVKVNDIIGRSIVISNGSDDLGRGTSQMSKVNFKCLLKFLTGVVIYKRKHSIWLLKHFFFYFLFSRSVLKERFLQQK